ncbi:MAG: phytanoyl-CoA dioxygenase family protein [Acidobacteriota bacterium]|nr:phytanoyl-CoA dioxygenase family protein [Acidobacteriota bacterium]
MKQLMLSLLGTRAGAVVKPLARTVVYGSLGTVTAGRRRWTKWAFARRHRDVQRRRIEIARQATASDADTAALRREGFLPWTSRLDAAALSELQQDVKAWDERAGQSKDFFKTLNAAAGLTRESAAVRLALDPRVIATAMAYFGEVPYLLSIDIIKSVRTASAPNWKKSQLWHKDHNDSRLLKLFIYLNDVDAGNGPFTFVPARFGAQQRMPYHPVHKRDDVVARHLGTGDFQQDVIGPAGTAFLIDTAKLLHRGSRIETDRHRLVYVATFTTFAQLVPRDNTISVDADALPEVERLLLRKTPAPVRT